MPTKTGRAYQLDVQDHLLDPEQPTSGALFTEVQDGRFEYRVFLYLTGRQVYLVDSVVYSLHPDMRPNAVRVNRTADNPNCKLTLWLWGTFEVTARVQLKTGEAMELQHYLSFGDRVKELPSDQFHASA